MITKKKNSFAIKTTASGFRSQNDRIAQGVQAKRPGFSIVLLFLRYEVAPIQTPVDMLKN